jgi:TonB family protein
MAAITYSQLALGWRPESERDHTFKVIALATVVCFLGLGLVMSSIPLPKEERAARSVVPERVARFIMERPKPAPKPAIKPPPLQPPKPEERIQRTPREVRKPLTKAEQQARKTAQGSGLLALAKELSDLADTSSINTMVARKINTAPTNTAAASVDTGILTSDTGRKSGGVRQDAHVGNVGTTKLDDNQQQLARGLLAAGGGSAIGSAGGTGTPGRGPAARGDENVAMVMDQHKSMLHSLYNRARRSNPGLKGKIVLVITIQPSGLVSNIIIKSSELNAPDLEASLVARIKQFDFGKRQGGPLTVTVPVEFLPS